MTIAEEMTRLYRQTPGCRALVFGDVQARTVLRAVADPDLRQEDHDRLLAEAAARLGGDPAASAFGLGPLGAVIRMEAGQTRLFLPSGDGGGEAFCARCTGAPGAEDLARLEDGLRALLADG